MEKLTIEQVESIKFQPIGMGQYPYKLKKIETSNPNQNVSGCILIEGNYYKPEYEMAVQPIPRKATNGRFSLDRIFGI